tara:strand:- start:1201 stop:1938 length:738 start_codon:yes stop_codon:yes gene_type:complete
MSKFPTEVIDLPSKGLVYPKEHPLSSGNVEIKYMTAKEEDILTSPNLIEKGIVLDKLLESIIVTEGVKLEDFVIGDKNTLLVSARILGYGKDYPIMIADEEVNVDLTTLKEVWLDEKNLVEKNKNEFKFKTPIGKNEITFSILDGHMEKKLEDLNKAYEKAGQSRELTNRYKLIIKSVDGKTERGDIDDFVDNLFMARDSMAFREYINDINPDIDFTAKVKLSDGFEQEVTVPMTVRFFWPNSQV